MGDAAKDLTAAQTHVERALMQEGERFSETLEQGIRILEQEISELSGTVIPGEVVFRLYDTYGFPADLTADVAREHNLSIDTGGFETAMQAQRDRARAASQFQSGDVTTVNVADDTDFVGYSVTEDVGTLVAINSDTTELDVLEAGNDAILVLDLSLIHI